MINLKYKNDTKEDQLFPLYQSISMNLEIEKSESKYEKRYHYCVIEMKILINLM